MSELEPCPHCRRHVRVAEAICPFCAAEMHPAGPAPLPMGRFARAAVFAGAALASACGGAQSKPDQQVQQEQAASADAGTPDAALPVSQPVPDHDIPMPYGAPPARRRLV